MGYWKSKVLPKIKKVFEKNGKKAAAAEACKSFDESKEEINKELKEKKIDLQQKVIEIYEASSEEIKVEKVIVVYPMRFSDMIDTVLATSFLQEFVEARRTAGLNNAPSCTWSSSPPLELKKAPPEALSANAGFVSFGNINHMGLNTFFLPNRICKFDR
ncbi:hypothetical protein SAY86_021746 [Trapa natans]|uniref:Plasma membrane-associated cation-binding protein 1 n=1 Tax=Trapa natans TaxID=22666 RepID=A0AAN7RDA0_TRANT|nr:hypothetical protein SAY86_021746 [Trapa natans]